MFYHFSSILLHKKDSKLWGSEVENSNSVASKCKNYASIEICELINNGKNSYNQLQKINLFLYHCMQEKVYRYMCDRVR